MFILKKEDLKILLFFFFCISYRVRKFLLYGDKEIEVLFLEFEGL